METEPDLRFCGLSLWILHRQFPDASGCWDSNWLTISAEMEASGAFVRCSGPILMTADVAQFRDGLTAMSTRLDGEAVLKGLEPNLNVILTMRRRGQIEVVIEITPEHMTQHHRFKVEADQSYLPALILSCDRILGAFPVKSAQR